ncbi:MAG: signal recognition particle protein [Candidatus Babeliales bacterium]
MFDFLSEKFSSIFSTITGKSHLTHENMQQALEKVREALLQADVPYHVVEQFIAEVTAESVGKKILTALKPGDQLIKIVHEKLKAFLGGADSVEFSFQLPSTVLVMGLQGSGKTTTTAKMAYWVQEQAKKRGKKRLILLASVDFYRPAAIDQLEILAQHVGVDFYRSSKADVVSAACDIHAYAKREGYDLLFLDTAGRLHIDNQMIQELRDIDTHLTPRYKFIVLDAMTGQESLTIAQAFEQGVGYCGAILTKLDSQTRAGAAFAFRYTQKKPIVFVGTGEKIADLSIFYADRMAGRILGMGDVLSLIEKAENVVSAREQESAYASLMKGRMTLQDFADQLAMMNKIGSLSTLIKYMPGAGGVTISPEQIEQGEKELKKFRAIISSMTRKERLNPTILDSSRKRRVAKGSGVQVCDVNILLERFEQSQQYAKLFKKFSKHNGLFR